MKMISHASKSCFVGLFAALALATANNATAQNLAAPVSGLQILDLAGNPITTAVTPWSADFTATSDFSTVTFVFRHDPGFFFLSDTSVTDDAGPATNLLLNPNFLIGAPTANGAPVPDWAYFIQNGNLFPQFLGLEDGSGDFVDGSTQAYDGIHQTFATTIGDTYTVSFDLSSTTSGGDYQQTSTNGDTTNTGGNGIDVVVYAGNGIPPGHGVPDTSTTCLLVAGGALALFAMRRLMARACQA
jgi:hypothetical protein